MELACSLYKLPRRKPVSCPNLKICGRQPLAPKASLPATTVPSSGPNLAKIIMDRRGAASVKARTAPAQLQMLHNQSINMEHQQAHNKEQPKKYNSNFHHIGLAIVILGGFVMGSMYYSRNFLPIAMLGMVNRTYLFKTVYPNTTLDNVFEPGYVEKGEFNWSNEMQQMIGMAYMIPYTIPQLAMTRLSLHNGIRNSITLWVVLIGISNTLIPLLAHMDWRWVLVMRFLDGLFSSPLMPSLIAAIETWIPEARAVTALSIHQFIFTTIYLMVPLVSGYITSIGWTWTFYSSTIFSFTMGLIWWLVARDSPENCTFVSQKELDEIQAEKSAKGKSKLPWHFMFKIPSFYSLALVYTLFCCIENSIVALLPTYFRKIMKFTTAENGFYNFLIQIGINFAVLWPQPVIACLQKYNHLSLTSARQVVMFTYSMVSFTALLYIALNHQHQIIILIIFKFFFKANHLVLTATTMSLFRESNTSGVVFSVINTIGNLLASFFCWLAGLSLDYTGESRQCWSIIFALMAVLHAIMFVIYFLFLKSQPVDLSKFTCSNSNNKNGLKGESF